MISLNNIMCYDSYGKYIHNFTQWDVNQTITVKDLEFEGTPIFHFSNKDCNRALGVKSIINENGSITAKVPNSLLQKALPLEIYLYIKTNQSGTTIHHSTIEVNSKPKPIDYEYTNNVDVVYIENIVNEIKELKKNLQSSVNDVIAKLENGEFNGKDGVNGTDGKDGLNGTDGQNGQDGIGISSANINVDGELVFTFSDNQTINLGKIVGKDGAPGKIGEKGDPGTTDYWKLENAPFTLPNPNALTIKIGDESVVYDGSSAQTIEIADGNGVAY